MLKKSILETSSPKSKNAPSINDNMGLAPNRLTQAFKESPQKLLSPASQQDTTADSLIRTAASDIARNMNTYQRKNIPQRMGSPTQLEASMSDRLQSNFYIRISVWAIDGPQIILRTNFSLLFVKLSLYFV